MNFPEQKSFGRRGFPGTRPPRSGPLAKNSAWVDFQNVGAPPEQTFGRRDLAGSYPPRSGLRAKAWMNFPEQSFGRRGLPGTRPPRSGPLAKSSAWVDFPRNKDH